MVEISFYASNAVVNERGVTQVTFLTRANPRGLQGNVPSKALLVPGSALILGLVCHAIPSLAWCSQLPVTVHPPTPTLRVHNGNSMAGAGLKRPVVNEQDQQKPLLVLHLPAF